LIHTANRNKERKGQGNYRVNLHRKEASVKTSAAQRNSVVNSYRHKQIRTQLATSQQRNSIEIRIWSAIARLTETKTLPHCNCDRNGQLAITHAIDRELEAACTGIRTGCIVIPTMFFILYDLARLSICTSAQFQ